MVGSFQPKWIFVSVDLAGHRCTFGVHVFGRKAPFSSLTGSGLGQEEGNADSGPGCSPAALGQRPRLIHSQPVGQVGEQALPPSELRSETNVPHYCFRGARGTPGPEQRGSCVQDCRPTQPSFQGGLVRGVFLRLMQNPRQRRSFQ